MIREAWKRLPFPSTLAEMAASRMGASAGKFIAFAMAAVTASTQASGAKLRVLVYDLAYLSPPTLAAAEREAAGVFAAARIEIKWIRGSRSTPEAHDVDFSAQAPDQAPCQGRPRSTLRLRIVESAPPRLNKHVLGLALPCAKFGTDATIFRDRIEAVAQNVAPFLPKILGHAMAHELGHVLLRSTEHSTEGVMKDRWSQSDFNILMTGPLPFTPEEADRIREELVRDSRSAIVGQFVVHLRPECHRQIRGVNHESPRGVACGGLDGTHVSFRHAFVRLCSFYHRRGNSDV